MRFDTYDIENNESEKYELLFEFQVSGNEHYDVRSFYFKEKETNIVYNSITTTPYKYVHESESTYPDLCSYLSFFKDYVFYLKDYNFFEMLFDENTNAVFVMSQKIEHDFGKLNFSIKLTDDQKHDIDFEEKLEDEEIKKLFSFEEMGEEINTRYVYFVSNLNKVFCYEIYDYKNHGDEYGDVYTPKRNTFLKHYIENFNLSDELISSIFDSENVVDVKEKIEHQIFQNYGDVII